MGATRVSTRTLPDGYRVFHHPPDDRHPEGKQVLCPGQSRAREKLLAIEEDNKAASAAKRHHHQRKVHRKRASMAAHPAVPPSKRPF